MSNLDRRPDEIVCDNESGQSSVSVLAPREVPLGGPRAMTVRRTLPHRGRTLVGSWCFVDHYGPDPVSDSGGMKVPRHPHTGLATVSWLFTGEIDHLDSAGNSATVRPGEVNLMVAGQGISHSEFSTADTHVLHGAQLWYALPDSTRHRAPGFQHYVPERVIHDGADVAVFIGEWLGSSSPVETYTPPLLGAEVILDAGAVLDADANPSFEYAVLVDAGSVRVDGHEASRGDLAVTGTDRTGLRLEAGTEGARLLVLGGEPLGEQILMWWNFIGRSHEEIVRFREAWQSEIGHESVEGLDEWFGPFPTDTPDPIPAPTLPSVRLRPRR